MCVKTSILKCARNLMYARCVMFVQITDDCGGNEQSFTHKKLMSIHY